MTEAKEMNILAASADWQVSPASWQANAEVIAKAVASCDTLPTSAKEQVEDFVTDRFIDLLGHYPQIDRCISDELIEYAPEIFEIVRWIIRFM